MNKECIIKVENMTKAFGKDVVLEGINTRIKLRIQNVRPKPEKKV